MSNESPDEKLVLVTIEEQIGDAQTQSRLVCDAPNDRLEETIAVYFDQFYGTDTERIGDNRWRAGDWQRALTVKSREPLTESEYNVLDSYLPNITPRCPTCANSVTGNPMDDDAAFYCDDCAFAFDPQPATTE